jgi:DNA recombination protein RmuC
MTDWVVWGSLGLIVGLLLWLVLRRPDRSVARDIVDQVNEAARQDSERLERELRDEVARSATATRQEHQHGLATFQQTLLTQSADVARTQNEQIDAFRRQLQALQQGLSQQSLSTREAQDAALRRFSESLTEQLRLLTESNDRRLGEVKQSVEARLAALQEGNEKKLEQMRVTVDEKLHATLEQRLGESFKQVADRLDQVHKGLGEMQGLARDVGSLSRVLTNVKSRGIFGEVQLAGLLDQVFTPEQYATNVATVPGRNDRVEFAIRLPGQRADGEPLWLPIDAKFPREDYERLLDAQERADPVAAEVAAKAIETRLKLEARTIREKYVAPPHTTDFAIRLPGQRADGEPLWLPIDAKFPREDYERLLDAQERADPVAAEVAAKAIETRLKLEARTIREKYVAPPHTTDFAILFVPTEGLYAEALRRPGLVEAMQREHKVMLAGPTTLLATLTSLQMGFRTLALERRSAEVWEVLGAVKTEFSKFGDVLVRTKKKLDEASNTIDQAEIRSRAMVRQLKGVEALPELRAQQLLPGGLEDDPIDQEGDAADA